MLLESHDHAFVFVSPEGRPWYRSNFRERYWRPAWDGVEPEHPQSSSHVPAILPWFTFHERRHTPSTWLTQDHVPEVARRVRLGHKMRGMGRVYDHVTPDMVQEIIDALEAPWLASLRALRPAEQDTLVAWFPHLGAAIDALQRTQQRQGEVGGREVDLPHFSQDDERARLQAGEQGR